MEIIVLVLFVILGILFWLRARLVTALDIALKILFPVLLLVGLSALFLPSFYSNIADSTLQNSGTLGSIQSIDSQIGGLISAPQQLVNSIGSLFGGETEQTEVSGTIIEDALYPPLVESVTGVIRIGLIIFSVVGMGLIVYLSYTTTSLAKVVHLEKRIEKLEDQLKQTAETA